MVLGKEHGRYNGPPLIQVGEDMSRFFCAGLLQTWCVHSLQEGGPCATPVQHLNCIDRVVACVDRFKLARGVSTDAWRDWLSIHTCHWYGIRYVITCKAMRCVCSMGGVWGGVKGNLAQGWQIPWMEAEV